jgi:hypothetical protein
LQDLVVPKQTTLFPITLERGILEPNVGQKSPAVITTTIITTVITAISTVITTIIPSVFKRLDGFTEKDTAQKASAASDYTTTLVSVSFITERERRCQNKSRNRKGKRKKNLNGV